jgi:DNA-binding MarR family transcriptional regulator
MNNNSNNKGALERARDRWNCALIHMVTKDKGRNASSVFTVGMLMMMHTSRAEYYRRDVLLAFPSLDRLAFMAGVSKSTIQRAIKKLTKMGLIEVKQRFNDSSFYYLTIPVAAEEHSGMCLDLLTHPRHRAARRAAEKSAKQPESDTQMTRGMVNSAPKHDVNDHLPTDDTLTYPRSLREGEDALLDEKRKGVGEEVRQVKEVRESPNLAPDSFSRLSLQPIRNRSSNNEP